MKFLTFLSLSLLTASCAIAQPAPTTYLWKATLRAVDESGNPISGANAQIGYYANSQPVNAEGLTDTNGLFATSHSALASMVEISFQADKPGYYRTWVRRELGPNYDPAEWTFTQTIALKKVGKPTGMFVKRLNTHVPDLDKPIGYDFMVGDWIEPYGKGANADILFTGHFDKYADGESDFTLTVGFPKKGDGLQEFFVPDSEKGSELRSPHQAPLDGYQPQWVQTDKRKPGKPIETNQDPSRNYIFRVRTILDPQGQVVSAQYGKIYGDFMKFDYYLNPVTNDRNLEFTPGRNLLQGLKSFEEVTAP